MDLSILKIKPQLVEIKLDSPIIIQEFGEEITFYIQDHQNIQTYFDFFKYQGDDNLEQLLKVIRLMLVNKAGKPILAENETLPITLISAIINKITEHMIMSDQKIKAMAKELAKPPVAEETEVKPAA